MNGESLSSSSSSVIPNGKQITDDFSDNEQPQSQSSLQALKTTKLFGKLSRKRSQLDIKITNNNSNEIKETDFDNLDTILPSPFLSSDDREIENNKMNATTSNNAILLGRKASTSIKKFTSSTIRRVDPTSPNSQLNNFFKSLSSLQDNSKANVSEDNSIKKVHNEKNNINLPVATNSASNNNSSMTILTDSIIEEVDEECDNTSPNNNNDNADEEFQSVLEFPAILETHDDSAHTEAAKISSKALSPRITRSFESLIVKKKKSLPELKISNHLQPRSIFKNNNHNSTNNSNSSSRVSSPTSSTASTAMAQQLSKIRKKLSVVAKQQQNSQITSSSTTMLNINLSPTTPSNTFSLMKNANSSSSSLKTARSRSSISRTSTSSAKSWEYRNFKSIHSNNHGNTSNTSTSHTSSNRERSNSLNTSNNYSNANKISSKSSSTSPAKSLLRNRIRSNSLNSCISVNNVNTPVANMTSGRRNNNNSYSTNRFSKISTGSIASINSSPRSSMFFFNSNSNNNNSKSNNSRRSSHILSSTDELFNQNGFFLPHGGNIHSFSKPNSPVFDTSNNKMTIQSNFTTFSDSIDSIDDKNLRRSSSTIGSSGVGRRRRSKTLSSLVSSSSPSSPSQSQQRPMITELPTFAQEQDHQSKRFIDHFDSDNGNNGSNGVGIRVSSFGLTSSRLKLNTNSSSSTIGAATNVDDSKSRSRSGSRSGSFLFSPSFFRSSSSGNHNNNSNSHEFDSSNNNINNSSNREKSGNYGFIISQVRQSLEPKFLSAKAKKKAQIPRPEDTVVTYLTFLINEGFSYEIVDILTSRIQTRKYVSQTNDTEVANANDNNYTTLNEEKDNFKDFNDSKIENLMEFKFGNNHTSMAQSIFYRKCLYLYTYLYFIDLYFNSDDNTTNVVHDVFPSQENILDYKVPYLDLISLASHDDNGKILLMSNNKTKEIQKFFMMTVNENNEGDWFKSQKALVTRFPLDFILRHFLFFNMLPKETEKIDLILQVLAYQYDYFIKFSHLKSIWRFVEDRPTYDDSNMKNDEKSPDDSDEDSDSDSYDDFQSTNEEFFEDTVIIHSPLNNEANKAKFSDRLSNTTSEDLTIMNSTNDTYTLLFILLVLQTDHFNKSNKCKMSLYDFTNIIRNFQNEDKSNSTLSLLSFPEINEYFYYNVTATPLKSIIEVLAQIPYVESVVQSNLSSTESPVNSATTTASYTSSVRNNSFVSTLLSPASPTFSSHVIGTSTNTNNNVINNNVTASSGTIKRKNSFFSSSNASLSILTNAPNLTLNPYTIGSSSSLSNYTLSNDNHNRWSLADLSVSSTSGNLSSSAVDICFEENFFENCYSEEFFQLFLHSEISMTPPIILKVDNSFDIGASAASSLAIPNSVRLEQSFKLGNEKIPMFTRIFQIGILFKKSGLVDSTSLLYNHHENYDKQPFSDSNLQFGTSSMEFPYVNEQNILEQAQPLVGTQPLSQQNQQQGGYLSKKASISKMKAKVKMNFSTTTLASSTTVATSISSNGCLNNSSRDNNNDSWVKCCAVLSSLGLSVFKNVNFELLEGYINGNEGKDAVNILHSSMLLMGSGELDSFIPAENLFAINLNADDSEFQIGWTQRIETNNGLGFVSNRNIFKEDFKCPEGTSSKWVNLINVIGAYNDLALDSRNKKITSLHVPGYPNIFELRTARQIAVDSSYKSVYNEIELINELLVDLQKVLNFANKLIPFTSKCRSVLENLVIESIPSKKSCLHYRKTILTTRLFLLGKLQGNDGVNVELYRCDKLKENKTKKKKVKESKEYYIFKDSCDIFSVVFSDAILQKYQNTIKRQVEISFDDILPEII